MSSDAAVPREIVSVRVPCGSHGCAFGPRRGLVGRFDSLVDEVNGLVWPVLTTFASVLPRRIGRLIRTEDNPNTEDDLIA